MRNKSLLLKLGLMAVAVTGFGLSFVSAGATIFHLDIEGIKADTAKTITDKMMYVHFADNDNNFGGFLYFSNGSGDAEKDPESDLYEVRISSAKPDVYYCRNKRKGFYYNAERGERLWPLDNETWAGVLANQGLTTTGGIYVNCVKEGYDEAIAECKKEGVADYTECEIQAKKDYSVLGFGYYGSLYQTYSGKNFNLTVGVDYLDNNAGNFISINPEESFAVTFEDLDNERPVGFVYDYNGGVGLAGCKFIAPNSNSMRDLIREYHDKGGLSKIFRNNKAARTIEYIGDGGDNYISCEPISVADTLLRIVIEGIVGMNEGGNEGNTKFGSIGNSTDTKMQYFGTKTVSNSTLMNYAMKKAELLCRGRWTNNTNKVFDTSNKNKIVCWNGGSIDKDHAMWLRNNSKTLIVKDADVTIIPETGANNYGYYDIAILGVGRHLIIDETGAKNFVFNIGGFVSDTTVEQFSGNVNNALCPGGGECNGSYNGNDAAVGSFIKGNFIVNGSVKGADGDLKNKYFVYGKFTTKDTFNTLEKTFGWTCENGFGSDGNYCPKAHDDWYNPYRNAALVVIDQNYGSPLLE